MPAENDSKSDFDNISDQLCRAEERGDKEVAAIAMELIHAYASKEIKKSPFLMSVQRAHECESRFDWEGAERAYREVLSDRFVSASESVPLEILRVQALANLCALFTLLGEEKCALETAVSATEFARSVNESILQKLCLKIALEREIELRLIRREPQIAHTLFNEEIKLSAGELKEQRTSWLPPTVMFWRGESELSQKKFKWPQSLILIKRARINIQLGYLKAAQIDLDAAWSALKERRDWTFLIKVQLGLASCWEAQALLCAAQSQPDLEIEALREAINYRTIVAQVPHVEGPYKFNGLAQAWFRLANALRAVDSPEAEEAFERSAEIRCAIGLAPLE